MLIGLSVRGSWSRLFDVAKHGFDASGLLFGHAVAGTGQHGARRAEPLRPADGVGRHDPPVGRTGYDRDAQSDRSAEAGELGGPPVAEHAQQGAGPSPIGVGLRVTPYGLADVGAILAVYPPGEDIAGQGAATGPQDGFDGAPDDGQAQQVEHARPLRPRGYRTREDEAREFDVSRQREAHGCAVRMTAHQGTANAQRRQERDETVDLVGQRESRRRLDDGSAAAEKVGGEHAVVASQAARHRVPLRMVGADPVQEKYRWTGARRPHG